MPEKFRQIAASAPMPSPLVKPKRMPWHEVVVVAVLLALLIGAGVFFVRQRANEQRPGFKSCSWQFPKIDRGASVRESESRDPENAYFADGIQDEILTRLSKIADLKVISRASTQHYKSAPDNLRGDRKATWRRPHPGRKRAEERRRRARERAANQSSQ